MNDLGQLFADILVQNMMLSFFIVPIAFWGIFKKAGENEWLGLVPIYNLVIMLRIIGKDRSYIGWLVVPGYVFIFHYILVKGLCERFKKGIRFGIGLYFLPFIFYPILAFDKSKYQKTESNKQTLQTNEDVAKQMYVDDMQNDSEIIRKLNLTRGTFAGWKNNNNWEEMRINRHKDKLLTHLSNKITDSPNDSLAAFKSIFMDLEVEPEFTDNEMMAGLKYIALNDTDPNKQDFAKRIMKEGNKAIKSINISINH